MSTHTVESIMGQVMHSIWQKQDSTPAKYKEGLEELKSALTQLVAERDAAIEEANDERKENQTHCACELHEVKGDDGITRMKASVTCYFHTLIERDRDALRSQLAEAREWAGELEAQLQRQNSCIVCSAYLLPHEEIPHCECCTVSEEHEEEYQRLEMQIICLVRQIEDKRNSGRKD